MPLREEHRRKLDDIVNQMISNKESDENIQFVVNDFKSKYETTEPQATTVPEQKGLFKSALEKAMDINVGAGKGIASGLKQITSPIEAVSQSALSLLPGGQPPQSPVAAYKELTSPENWENKLYAPEGKVQEVSKNIGEFATKAGVGMAATAGMGGAGIVPALTRGAVANIPFVPGELEKGGIKGATDEILINTALDAALFGTGKLVGAGIKKLGIETMLGELKIEKPLARKVSQSFDAAKTKIAQTINKYKLESVVGNFDSMAKKADDLAAQKYKSADDLVDQFTKSNPGKKVNVVDVYEDMKNFLTGTDSPLGSAEIDAGIKMVDDIIAGQKKRGLIPNNGLVTLTDLVKIKRDLKKGIDVFKRGGGYAVADPTKIDVYKTAFYNVVDKISESVPEAKKLNTEAKDLFFVKDAADAAASRIRNHNKIWGFAEGTGGMVNIGLAIQNPEKAIEILGTTAAILGGRRALSQGRGASALIKGGEQLQKFGPGKTAAISGASGKIAEILREEEERKEKERLMRIERMGR